MIFAGLGILSFFVASLGVYVLLSRFAALAPDQPNARSLHERPVPRTGGIAVLLGALVSLAFGAVGLWLPITAALMLAVLSFVDDVWGVPTAGRLAGHLAATALAVWYLLSPMDPVHMLVLIFALTWITNLYNFMDGSDGLAGGMTAIGFGAYGVAAYLNGHGALAAISFALTAAAAAFLVYNFHPARIFLGDVGSIPLGFLSGTLGLVGWRDDVWPLWFPILTFAPFIADATVTLVRRSIRAERVWQAHREHYYQRMIRMGLGHRKTACIGYAVMIVCVSAALFGRGQAPATQAAVFIATSALLGAMAVWVDLSWSRHMRKAAK